MSLFKVDRELFDPFFGNWKLNHETSIDTKVNLKETPNSFEISLECPGVPKENIKIEHIGGRIKISGEVKKDKEEKDEKHHLVERSYGKFERQFHLPKNANIGSIKAKNENGMLLISIPKQKIEADKTNIINIE